MSGTERRLGTNSGAVNRRTRVGRRVAAAFGLRSAGIRGGRSLNYGGAAHNKILVTMANFAGVPISEFGTTDDTPGPLPGLT